ncbi:deoxyribodipyrimidine photo-lyase [Algiphilus sp.]|uniref:cryptochrome/photolyase family protein n=1 Tax=Algiphilus sp. TaxID=1872431 RepID=UPI0032EFE5C3
MSTHIVWFRRDLRLADNPALYAALEEADAVLPVYIHAPEQEADWPPGAASRWWLHHSLNALHAALEQRGSGLIVRAGDPLTVLQELIAASGATAVHWGRCYEAAAIARDRSVKAALREAGISVRSHASNLMAEPWTLATGNGDPYRVYSPFARRFHAFVQPSEPLPAPARVPLPEAATRMALGSAAIDALELLPRIRWDEGLAEAWSPGEAGAQARLQHFVHSGAGRYDTGREAPGTDGTSRLSPHLHFGELSPRQAWAASEAVKDQSTQSGVEHFQRELIWREFAYHLIYHYPHTVDTPLNPRFADFPWRSPSDYAEDLRAFQRGQTGIPIVDAGMRQLWHTGWMHNRVRMIVGSFLTKNLLIPWQEGARWFWDTLVDADLASNTLGWQWAAGSGADAAPYFRIFNPILQSQKFDADGAYVREWVPEIAALPNKPLHAPWEASASVLREAGIRLGEHYPEPRVDLKASRQRALDAYEKVKG